MWAAPDRDCDGLGSGKQTEEKSGVGQQISPALNVREASRWVPSLTSACVERMPDSAHSPLFALALPSRRITIRACRPHAPLESTQKISTRGSDGKDAISSMENVQGNTNDQQPSHLRRVVSREHQKEWTSSRLDPRSGKRTHDHQDCLRSLIIRVTVTANWFIRLRRISLAVHSRARTTNLSAQDRCSEGVKVTSVNN